MTSQPALPFSPADVARLRARHQADQAEALEVGSGVVPPATLVLATARLLLVAFVLVGCYAVAAAAGVAPAMPGSAVAGG